MKPARVIETNGKELYFSFGMAAMARFTDSEGITIADLAKMYEEMTLMRAIKLVYAGLQDGFRREKVAFSMTFEDVADLLDEDPELLSKCMDVINTSMPNAETGNAKAAKLPKRPSR